MHFQVKKLKVYLVTTARQSSLCAFLCLSVSLSVSFCLSLFLSLSVSLQSLSSLSRQRQIIHSPLLRHWFKSTFLRHLTEECTFFLLTLTKNPGGHNYWDFVTICYYHVCVCVCVFISFHRRGFSWLKQNNKCNARDQASDFVLKKLLCVKYLHRHVIGNHSRDIEASHCARVSIKPGGATRS